MRNSQIKVISAADSASITGAAFFVGQIIAASFVPVFGDATAAGTLKIQCSNDIPLAGPNEFTPTNWVDVPNATSTIASGTGPAIVIGSMCFAYIRAVYTRSGGGTTTATVYMNTLGQ